MRTPRYRDEKGNTTAELALTLPILMFAMLGLVDFGRGLAAKAAIGSAVRAAARYASVRSTTSTDPASQTKIETYLRDQIAGLNPEGVTVTTAWSPANTRGSRVQIHVAYTFVPIMPFIPVSSIELTSSSESIISN
jgi:Flp pilus assembly protein TadG